MTPVRGLPPSDTIEQAACCLLRNRYVVSMPSVRAATPDFVQSAAADQRPSELAAEAAGTRTRVLAAVLCAAFVAMPFLMVRYPPITDLPQHVAQIRLLLAALGNPD